MAQPLSVAPMSKPAIEFLSEGFVNAPTHGSALSWGLKLGQKENIDGPEHKFQVNELLLYEHEFHGHCFVSAHLQRLQHGVFGDSTMHSTAALHVTFVAITFVFHPSVSLSHRFQSTVIEVTARTESGEPLRFIKFAPHIAFGRISTETLKWNFQLGATIGVTKGPAILSVNPSISTERDKVLGAMMKIQGSTRCQHSSSHLKRKIPDTKLVWSLEENDQQETGLPREFTFVFLIARPTKTKELEKGKKDDANYKDKGAAKAVTLARSQSSLDRSATFTPMYIGINVKPRISNIVNNLPIIAEYDEALVSDEVGQRLAIEHTHDAECTDMHTTTSGYYNFAKMPGNFEDLIELPGNSVTSVEPTVGDK